MATLAMAAAHAGRAASTHTSSPQVDGFESLERIGVRRRFAPGSVLMHQGERAECVHLLLAGSVRVQRMRVGGAIDVLADLTAGEIVGEMGVVGRELRSATVIARSEVETLEVRLDSRRLTLALLTSPRLLAELGRIADDRRVTEADLAA